MNNTTILPTYAIKVEFSWKYPGKPIINIEKQGYVQTTNTEDKLIAEEFINTFIGNYEVGICEVTEMNILSLKRIKTVDEWMDKYNPIKNHLDENTSFDGCSFETFDDELEFVQSQDPHNIWTMVNVGDESYIVPGFRWVNRENYLISEVPFTDENLHDEYLVI